MTHLALRCSRFINGVAMRHQEVSQEMFPEFPIGAITNGVHATTWTAEPFRQLFDTHIPEWRRDNLYLRYAIRIPLEEIRAAHREAKPAMLDEVEQPHRDAPRPEGVHDRLRAPRHAVQARGPDLLGPRPAGAASRRNVGPIQLVFGGKAHPQRRAAARS